MNPPPPPPVLQAPPAWEGRLVFGDLPYHHRWSKDGQHEFTPAGQADLEQWVDLLTVVVHDRVRTGEQLAELANQILERYKSVGRVFRTDSVPRREGREAEHFALAVLRFGGNTEVTFARFVMVEGRGMVVVRSHRFYGNSPDLPDRVSAWLQAQGPAMERTLMAWPTPSPALLSRLPGAK